MRPFTQRLGALGLCVLLAACSHSGSKAMAGPQPIRIGFLAPLSGADSESGRSTLAAAQLAVDHVNEAGGISGHSLALVARDTQALDDPAAAIPLARELADEGVVALVVRGSGSTRAVLTQVAKPRGIPVLTPSGAGVELSALRDDGLLFRTVPSDAYFARAIARVLQDDRQARVALVARNLLYARSLEPALRTELGNRFAGAVFYPDTDRPDPAQVFRQVPAGTTAVLLLGAARDQAALLKAWKADAKRKPYRFYFHARQKDTALPAALGGGALLEGLKGVAPVGTEGPHYAPFREAFKAATRREPDVYAARTYDTVVLCALAMVMGGAGTPVAIQRNLTAVSAEGAQQRGLGPAGLKDALSVIRSGTDFDYEGAAGAMDLDTAGEVHGDYAVWIWRSGRPVETGEVIRF